MAGKAKILTSAQFRAALAETRRGRYPERDRVLLLLSAKAGCRAIEMANLLWRDVLDAQGRVADHIELRNEACKRGSGRIIPMHPDLKRALIRLRKLSAGNGPVIRSERNRAMRASSICNWFAVLYRRLSLDGCSSHSGRRTFITRAARLVASAGGSLRDVQLIAGHKNLAHTQTYIDGDTAVQRRLVARI